MVVGTIWPGVLQAELDAVPRRPGGSLAQQFPNPSVGRAPPPPPAHLGPQALVVAISGMNAPHPKVMSLGVHVIGGHAESCYHGVLAPRGQPRSVVTVRASIDACRFRVAATETAGRPEARLRPGPGQSARGQLDWVVPVGAVTPSVRFPSGYSVEEDHAEIGP